jgi:CheY-like chemotaxis protein
MNWSHNFCCADRCASTNASLLSLTKPGSVTVRAASRPCKGSVTDSIKLHNGETAAYERSNVLVLSVTDTGAGMTEDQLSKVFGAGVQFDVNKLQAGKGSGLGLYIAKGIIEQHGGSLSVDSPGLGLGTTFTMMLPLYKVPVDQRAAERKACKEALPGCAEQSDVSECNSSEHPTKTLNVLVVDDSAMNRKLLVRLLKNQGHTCTEAENGLVAVARVKEVMAENKLFDSILMDCEMPEMDGPTAAQMIRAMGCDSFIVGITGALFTEQVNHFVTCGANRVLPKPLDLRALLDIWMEYGIL